MGVSIKVEGLQKVELYLKNVSAGIQSGANDAVKEASFYVQTEVIQTCAEIPACVCPVCPQCPISNCDVTCGDLQFPSNLNLTVSNVSV